MYERLENCPVCESPQFVNFMICQDYTVSQESFAIVECKKCHFKFTNPRPTEKNIGKYYKSTAYISHSNSKTGIINQVYHLARKFTLGGKLRLVNSLNKTEKKILDVGCGTGKFLEVCKQNGWIVAGTEPDEHTRNQAIKYTNAIIEDNLLTSFDGQLFEVITLWHVLEHVHLLNEVIAKIKKLLAPDGTLVIAVPNCESNDAKIYKEKWAAYDVPRHLYHFSQSTLKLLFQKHKMQIQEVQPMKLDAYYVSLLSSKYRYGKVDYLKALKSGYDSNKWAEDNDNNYSSLIYIIQQ